MLGVQGEIVDHVQARAGREIAAVDRDQRRKDDRQTAQRGEGEHGDEAREVNSARDTDQHVLRITGGRHGAAYV